MSSANHIGKNATPLGVDAKEIPALPRFLFWDYRYDDIEWRDEEESIIVITRVLDRGNDEDFGELVRFYGKDAVLQVLMYESIYLMDHSIEHACTYFNLQKEELACYWRKLIRGTNWI